jgi:hypothetical protein
LGHSEREIQKRQPTEPMCAVEREYGVHPFARGACPSLYTEGISLYNVSKRNNHGWLSKSGVLFVLVAEIAHTPVNEFRK